MYHLSIINIITVNILLITVILLLFVYEKKRKTKNIEETVTSVTSDKKRKMQNLDESMNSSRSLSTTYSSDEEIKEKKSPTKEELIKLLENANNKIAQLQSTLEVTSLRMC